MLTAMVIYHNPDFLSKVGGRNKSKVNLNKINDWPLFEFDSCHGQEISALSTVSRLAMGHMQPKGHWVVGKVAGV
jgi:hypothetical protein